MTKNSYFVTITRKNRQNGTPSMLASMKKAILLLLSLILFLACSKENKELEGLTRQFIQHMNEGENHLAGQLGTESTKRFLAYRTASMIELGQPTTTDMKIEKIKCAAQEDKAACRFCCDPNGDEFAVPYIRQNDRWLVDINIDDLIKASEK